jgi:hypothetical protein
MLTHPRLMTVYGAVLFLLGIYFILHNWEPYTPERVTVLAGLYAFPLLITAGTFWLRAMETPERRLRRILVPLAVCFSVVGLMPSAVGLNLVRLASDLDLSLVVFTLGLIVLLGGVLISFISFFEHPWQRR